jgi:hypothetical protein
VRAAMARAAVTVAAVWAVAKAAVTMAAGATSDDGRGSAKSVRTPSGA